ncbi:MAG: YqgE/AlgH family protein [Bacteroidales bacterium]|nr:YqgE/AlgH family protein [Bacteroidales bacterium]
MGKIDDILNKNLNKLQPKVGRVLVSSPTLFDMYFRKSLILITEISDTDTVGYMLNKYSGVNLDAIVTDFAIKNIKVFIGGPIGQDRMNFIHSNPNVSDSLEICEGIYWGGSFEDVEKLMIRGELLPEDIKFFVGYCGWQPDQLNEEIISKTWIVVKEDTIDDILSDDCNWEDVINNLDDTYKLWKNYPNEPFLN